MMNPAVDPSTSGLGPNPPLLCLWPALLSAQRSFISTLPDPVDPCRPQVDSGGLPVDSCGLWAGVPRGNAAFRCLLGVRPDVRLGPQKGRIDAARNPPGTAGTRKPGSSTHEGIVGW